MTVQRDLPIPFLVTVDDAGGLIQDLDMLRRALDFFDSESMPATFFTVPQGEGGWRMDEQPEWLSLMRPALERGHDAQLHGLDHGSHEFGPYMWFIYGMGTNDPESKIREAEISHGHLWLTDLFVERLTLAQSIFSNAFGRAPLCFRGGALTHSPELYEALGQLGIRYVSNNVTDIRGWRYIAGEYDTKIDWDAAVPPRPYTLVPGITDLPIMSEYAWYLTPEKIEPHLALAMDDLQRVHGEGQGAMFLLVCHVQCVGDEEGLSRQLLSRFFAQARDQHQLRPMTVTELVADIEAGVVAVA